MIQKQLPNFYWLFPLLKVENQFLVSPRSLCVHRQVELDRARPDMAWPGWQPTREERRDENDEGISPPDNYYYSRTTFHSIIQILSLHIQMKTSMKNI